ncbi:MAG: nuclease-related domain-containing protein, partial [Rhodanobacteraceae bacterium]
LILALQNEPGHEQRWAKGAKGEERVASSLAKYLAAGVWVLHDRGIPRSSANIDHIAVGPPGVWVIDAKRYDGKAEIKRPLFGAPKLLIKGRDQTKLVDGLARQVELVRAKLVEVSPEIPIHGALCFIDTELPMVGTLTIRGFSLLRPRRLAKRINAPGPLTAETVEAVLGTLEAAFPRA